MTKKGIDVRVAPVGEAYIPQKLEEGFVQTGKWLHLFAQEGDMKVTLCCYQSFDQKFAVRAQELFHAYLQLEEKVEERVLVLGVNAGLKRAGYTVYTDCVHLVWDVKGFLAALDELVQESLYPAAVAVI
jgi:hypothetical protein